MIPDEVPFDREALVAGVELIGRAAARALELGWTDDDGPRPGEWYAQAMYKGVRVIVEDQHGPVEAVEALAAKLMEGGACVHCGHAITVTGVRYADGRRACEWHRDGEHWLRGCDSSYGPPAKGLSRAQRRRQDRAKKLR